MRKTEKILLILIALGILAKIFLLPGSGILVVIATLAIGFLYFPLGFAFFTRVRLRKLFKNDSYKHLKPVDIILSIFTGIGFQSLIIGLLFQLQYWPGANIMSLSGLISSLPFIITAAFMLKSSNKYVYIGILKRGIPLFLFVLSLYLTPLTTKLKVFKVDPRIEAYLLNNYKSTNSN